ncbi:glycoside hydrolase family 3 C-terminal domain-containing protein [Sphingomonas sp.]|jgi:beta-glucosidase|uniref:glycoside hydrolase family 3 C-terminal domain-containing protein n=1 Tax=Sphingomonas sp. TaxID=28214 RepID=UPI002EDB6736
MRKRLPMLVAAMLLTAAEDRPTAIDRAIATLSVEEKAAQLQNDAPAVPRIDLPAYDYWNEGLHGLARNGVATVFPQATALAATFDAPLIARVGDVISTEARARANARPRGAASPRYGGLTIWSPNINIYRDPRWGRGQETYGEDPYLTGQLATAFVRGLQGPDPRYPKVIATPKHLAAHSGPEAGRDGFDVDVSPYDMEATYTPAFRAAIVEGKARSVMCAYNSIAGVPVCASSALLNDRLRKDWGFTGLTVSDCDAVSNIAAYHHYRRDRAGASAAALAAGLDLNCGHAYAGLPEAVARDETDPAQIDTALARVFQARHALGTAFGGTSPWTKIKPSQVDTPTHRALALEAARKAMVLLKNDGDRLPLKAGARIAVVGPNADALESLEANYHGTAAQPITPLMGLRAQFGTLRVRYAQGSAVAEGVAVTVPETALSVQGSYFDTLDLSGRPRVMRADRLIAFDWDRAAPAKGMDATRYAVRWTGTITPPGPGAYTLRADIPRCFDCRGHDPVRVWIDGKPVIDDDGSGKAVEATLDFADAAPHAIRVELVHAGEDGGIRLQWRAPAAVQLAEAAGAMADADAIVAVVGLSPDVEGEALGITVPGFEGGDRTDIGLPRPQQALLEAAAATGKPLIVVLMSGGAVAIEWAKAHAHAILAAWYPGQAGGQAIAETLAGANNPGGRLPVTFYRSTRDLPAFVDYSMRERTYRYFTGTPLYPFGHGLSYTRFAYAQPSVAATLAAGETLSIAADVTNTGAQAGDEVVQLYLVPPAAAPGPLGTDPVLQRALAGFQRLSLKPGETKRVRFALDARGMSSVDRDGVRAVVPGMYRLFLGGGQPGDAPGVEAGFTVTGREELPK